MLNELFLLGPDKPDVKMIQEILESVNKSYLYCNKDGERVNTDTKNQGDEFNNIAVDKLYLIECQPEKIVIAGWPVHQDIVKIENVVGSPREYWEKSAIGNFYKEVFPGYNPPEEIRMSAAADYSLRAAYSGLCPGVDKSKLYKFRIEKKKLKEKDLKLVEVLLRGVFANIPKLLVPLGWEIVVNLMGGIQYCTECECIRVSKIDPPFSYKEIAEHNHKWKYYKHSLEGALTEFSCYIGIPVLYTVPHGIGEGGKKTKKVKLVGSDGRAIKEFMASWARKEGIRDVYGDSDRGYAGGYLY